MISDYASYIGLAAALSYIVGGFLFRKDEEMEDKKRAARDLGTALREVGLVRIPEALDDFAVGDWSAVWDKVKFLVNLFKDKKALFEEFNAVFGRVLAKKVATAEGLAEIEAAIAAVKGPVVNAANPSVPVKAPNV